MTTSLKLVLSIGTALRNLLSSWAPTRIRYSRKELMRSTMQTSGMANVAVAGAMTVNWLQLRSPFRVSKPCFLRER